MKVSLEELQLQAGDVVLFADNSRISSVIRYFTRAKDEARTRFSHVGQMISKDQIGEQKLKCVIQPAYKRLLKGRREVWRYNNITIVEQVEILRLWRASEGTLYGWWTNIPHLIDGLGSKLWGDVRIMRAMLCSRERTNCSGRVGLITNAVLNHIAFIVKPGTESPDDIHDAMKADDRWRLVVSLKGGKYYAHRVR